MALTACPPDRVVPANAPERVLRWLTCDECVDGELSYVIDSIGRAATPLLRQALVDTPSEYLANAERALRVAYSRREAPLIPEDEYVPRFLANYRATLQARAAVGLGELDETAILQDAYDRRVALNFRADVVAAIEDALAQTEGGRVLPPAVASILLRPDTLEMALGTESFIEGVPLDSAGRTRAAEFTWTLSNVGVLAGVDTGDTWIRVRGVAIGEATVTATTLATTAQSTVRVVPPGPPPGRLSIVSGSGQVFRLGGPHLPLVVRVEDADGDPIFAAQVNFRTIRGGSPVEVVVLTDTNGEARLDVISAPVVGPVWVDAVVTASSPGATVRPSVARFQLRADP